MRKLINFYVTHKFYLEKGFAQISFIKWIFQFYTLTAIWIKIVFDNDYLIKIILPIMTIGLIIFCWSIGYFWDKIKGWSHEADFGNLRNPFVQEVLDYIKREKK